MFRFSKNKQSHYDNAARKDPEIKKARRYLESVHSTHSFLHGDKSFHYMKTCKNGIYKRYCFYKGNNKELIFIALSSVESTKINKMFHEKVKDDSYVYLDTVLNTAIGSVVCHRFYRPEDYAKSFTFMNDNGEILDTDMSIFLEK